MEEEWRPIKGTNNCYYVSNLGRVKSVDRVTPYPDGRKRHVRGKLVTQANNKHGYLVVSIGSPMFKTQLVHRLVAQAFVKNVSGGNCINHINGNKKDNRYTNLEWCSIKENTHHAIKTGLMKSMFPPKPIIAYKGNKVVGVFKSMGECANKLNCDKRNISGVIHGRLKTHHGFSFKLVNDDDLNCGSFRDCAIKMVAIKGTQAIKAKSLYELAKKLGVSTSSLDFALKEGTKVKGYIIRKDVSTND